VPSRASSSTPTTISGGSRSSACRSSTRAAVCSVAQRPLRQRHPVRAARDFDPRDVRGSSAR
jgi:hypothetical protein